MPDLSDATLARELRDLGPWLVTPLAGITHLVTDAGEELTADYAAAGVSVVRA